ncbi:MAG: energy-coupling factor transporter transmembrane component T, partial [Acidobacteriota bacterium]|nr:energy-coupling factor transporter transmembrane component T [Acidobacteriota bacterium]
IKRVRALVPVVVPLLYGVFRRADDLAIALTLRGYTPGLKRSRMKTRKVRVSDIGTLIGTSAIFAAFIWL